MLVGLCFSEARKELNEGLRMLIVAVLGPPIEFVRANESDVVISDDPEVIERALDSGRAALHYCFGTGCEMLDHPIAQRRAALEVVHHTDEESMERFYAFLISLRTRLYRA